MSITSRVKIESQPEESLSSHEITQTTVTTENLSKNVDDDEIVREIDVFLCPETFKQLFLLQYPLQYELVAPTIAARIKPRHNCLEIDHPLPNGIERDGKFDMTHRTYQSQPIPIQTHLCIGKMKIDEKRNSSLHLVPLTHITQMRPSFKHVDDAYEDPRVRERKLEEAEARATEKKPLAFKRKESERAQIARLSSYAYKKQSEESEEWYDLKIQENQSTSWHSCMKKIIGTDPTQYVLNENCDETSYIRSLNYLSTSLPNVVQYCGSDMRSIASYVATLMRLGCPIPFSLIRLKIGSDILDETLLDAMNSCSVLVRGNFCLQSKFLNLDDALKPIRTFILLLLDLEGFVDRSKVSCIFKNNRQLTPEKLLRILEMVSKRNRSKNDNRRGWIPKIEDDTDFITNHPIVKRQHHEYWKKQKQRFAQQLNAYMGHPNTIE